MILHNFDVLRIVVPVCPLDWIEDVEAVLQLLVELDVVDGMGHLIDFDL